MMDSQFVVFLLLWFLLGCLVDADDMPSFRRCGHSIQQDEDLDFQQRPMMDIPANGSILEFNLTLHVFEDTPGRIVIPQRAVDEQIAHVKQAFLKSQIKLNFNPVLRYRDNVLAENCLEHKNTAYSIAQKVKQSIHVFVCRLRENSGVLGYSQLPCAKLNPFTSTIFDGVAWVDYRTMPQVAESFPYFNLGNTMVHELGHVFGLLHTFHQETCTGQGDLVADTPHEGKPFQGGKNMEDCTPTDSCPLLAGLDPVQNYMNYSPDPCMTEFTPGQAQRMKLESSRCLADRFSIALETTTTEVAEEEDVVTVCRAFKTSKLCNAAKHCRFIKFKPRVPKQCRALGGCRSTLKFCDGLCLRACKQVKGKCAWRKKLCVKK